MYDMNTILKAMAEGKTADDLAKEFTDALNAANAKLEADRIEAEEAAKAKLAAERAKSARINRLAKIMEDIIAYILDYYKDMLPKDIADELSAATLENCVETAKEVDALIEEIAPSLPLLIKMAELQESFGNSNIIKVPSIKVAAAPVQRGKKRDIKTLSDDEAGDILSQFLKDLSKF